MSLSKIESALGFLVLLLSVFIFPSCIETNYTLGDALVPTSNNLYVETATLDLQVGMKSSADIQSSSYYDAMGSVVSEQFGLTTVDLAATITPPSLDKCNHSGTVQVSFAVGKDGYVKDVDIVTGVCEELDNLVLKAISASPKWEPARSDDGQPKDVYLRIPIVFDNR